MFPLQDEEQSPPRPVELQWSIFVFSRAQHEPHNGRSVSANMAVCPAVMQIESVLQALGLRNRFLHVCKSCEVHTMLFQGASRVVPGRELQTCGCSHAAPASRDGSLHPAASPQVMQHARSLGSVLMLLVDHLWLKVLSLGAPDKFCLRAGWHWGSWYFLFLSVRTLLSSVTWKKLLSSSGVNQIKIKASKQFLDFFNDIKLISNQ